MSDNVIALTGRIDSTNAGSVEEQVFKKLEGINGSPVIDMNGLEYISSAGLRILLRVKKSHQDMKIINVSSEVYEILEMTGFTEMMEIEKAYRVVSVDGCEVVGVGANGTIYRIDNDTVVKAYNNMDALDDIRHEREVARLALILGIPTAISYDVVRVGDSYGSVFELLNARSFSKIIATEPDRFEWVAEEYVKLLKKIHSTEVPEGKLPNIKDTAVKWVFALENYLPSDKFSKLKKLVDDVPEDNHMIHGDYHTKNIMLQGDEVLLIDMDTLSVGNPIFEFGQIYNSLHGFSEYDHDQIMRFQGYDYDTGWRLWKRILSLYLGTEDGSKIDEVSDKARIIGYTKLIRRILKKGEAADEKSKAELKIWTDNLLELLDKYDTLSFSMDELVVEAAVENLPTVQAYIEERLEAADCPMKAQMQISLAAEEIFVNIANYAYNPGKGKAIVRVEVSSEPAVIITFMDNGKPYDPLAKEDPDITLSAEERAIGGLGIFLTKKTMDDVSYEYKNGQNILKLKKNI